MRNWPRHEPTDSYFYLAINISKCLMIADIFNFQVDPVRMEITSARWITISQVFSLDKRESKGIIVDKILSQVCSTDKSESKWYCQ